MQFIKTLNGFHPQIAMAFTQTFNGYQAQVGGLTLYVLEGFIPEAFKLDILGERWFKKGEVNVTLLNQFLLPEFQNPGWSKGIPIKFLQKEWKMILILIKKYITCEGRYSHVSMFHMKFLLHITEDTRMNLPFFILKSL